MPPIVRSAYLRTTGAPDVIASRDFGSAVTRLGIHRSLIADQRGTPGPRCRDMGFHEPALLEGVTVGGGGGGGYMSDGDIVRTACHRVSVDDSNCGYMSEGGVSLYMKRMQQRFREGMLAVRESIEKSNGMTDEER